LITFPISLDLLAVRRSTMVQARDYVFSLNAVTNK